MPSKPVITVAMTDGSCAEDVAVEAARRLAYRYVDEEIIERAASLAGVDPGTIGATEHSEPLVSRILRRMTAVPLETSGYIPPEWLADQTPAYRTLIKRVIHSVAAEGSVVIGSHAAALNLAGTAGLLRVLVTAPPGVRAHRLASERGIELATAQKAIEHADAERRKYFQRFFHLDHELPVHYDLVLNTEVLSPVQAAGLIVLAAS